MTPLRNILFTTVYITGLMTACAPFAGATDVPAQTAHEEGDVAADPHDLVQGSHVEGHIAFLKAELGITHEQETLWAPVAEAMREDVRTMQEAEHKATHQKQPNNAIEYLENRAVFAELRAQGEARFLVAFRPLYNNLSGHQKQTADALLIPAPNQ